MPESADDLNRKYSNCYFRAFSGVYPVIIGIHEIYREEDHDHLVGELYSSDGRSVGSYVGDMGDIVIDLTFPDLGAVNTPYGAVFVSKNVERQWTRGLRSGVVSLTPFDREDISFDSTIACSILRKKVGDMKEGLDHLMGGEIKSFAIYNDVTIAAKKDRQEVSLYYNTDEVGYVCLFTGDMILREPFSCLLEHLKSKGLGEVRMEGL